MKVSELQGAELDYWVAMAAEIWKNAHEMYPTMTLDPTFSGVEIRGYMCILVPNNPMRQEPQEYCPSTNWAQGGSLIEKYKISLLEDIARESWSASKQTLDCPRALQDEICTMDGDTALIAACRSLVAMKFGDEVPDIAEGETC